jgi:hypothetical protein
METLICVFCCFEMLLATAECEKIAAELAFKYALISPSRKLHSRWRDQSERAKNAGLRFWRQILFFIWRCNRRFCCDTNFPATRKIAGAIRSAATVPQLEFRLVGASFVQLYAVQIFFAKKN